MDTRDATDRFLRSPALAESTRRAYAVDLAEFGTWLRGRGETLDDVDGKVLAEYTSMLGAAHPGRQPRRLARATIARKLAAVRGADWLYARAGARPGRGARTASRPPPP